MNAYFFVLVLLVLAIASFVVIDRTTGGVVAEENPCRLIDCDVRIFGFWQTKAEWLYTTPDGLAVCHCSHEPMDRLYYVSLVRKY